MSKRTLLVSEIKNFTEETVWVYGTSGKVVGYEPTRPSLTITGELAPPTPGTYYIAEGFVLDILMADADMRYNDVILKATPYGHGPEGKPIYTLSTTGFKPSSVVPITDGIGFPGYMTPIANRWSCHRSKSVYITA